MPPIDEPYRAQVQSRITDLISGARPRDPHLSSVSTRRLILEGVIEEVRIYRLRKEEKLREERMAERGSEHRGEGRKHRHRSREGDGHRRHRSREGDGHRRHRSREGDGHRRHRSREGDGHRRHRSREGDGHRRHRSREGDGHRRHRSREGDGHRRHRSRERGGKAKGHSRHGERRHRGHHPRHQDTESRDIPSPVTESSQPSPPNPSHVMTGAAGSAGTLPSSPSRSSPSAPSPSRSPNRRRRTPRPCGPDGTTPFGDLPKKAAGVGLSAHVLSTYRHIKAEHEAGHRERGDLERVVDRWRGKGKGGEKLRKERHGKGEGEKKKKGSRLERRSRDDENPRNDGRNRDRRSGDTRGSTDDGSNRPGQEKHFDRSGYGDRGDRDDERPHDSEVNRTNTQRRTLDLPHRPPTPYAPRQVSSPGLIEENTQRSCDPSHSAPHGNTYPRAPTPPSTHVQDAMPLVAYRHEGSAWPPAPTSPPSGARSPPPLRADILRSHDALSVYSTMLRPRPASPSSLDASRSRPNSSAYPRSRSSSPPYPETPSDIDIRSAVPIPHQTFAPHSPHMPPSAPPPPPLPPAGNPKPPLAFANILDEISKGIQLRKVTRPDTNDDVPHFTTTPHSREVEDRERGQASVWSNAEPDEGNESERMRELERTIERGRLGELGSRPSEAESELMMSDREGVNCDEVRERWKEDGVFENVGISEGTPSWEWGGLGKERD